MKNLKSRISINIIYFTLWVAYFVFARLFFLLFYFNKTTKLGLTTALKTFLYGIRLDISFAGYLCLIPFLLIIFTIFTNSKKTERFFKLYSSFLIVFISLLLIIDASLYEAWGVRLDTSLLPYLNTPKLMISSASRFQLISGVFLWIVISYIFISFFNKTIQKSFKKVSLGHWLQAPLFLLVFGALMLPIRGGLQTIPVNQSNVYFSSNMFANHAAINFIWNFFNTITHKTDNTNQYQYFDNDTAKNIINKTRNQLLKADTDSILTPHKPNIILIIWESLSAKIVGSLDGEPNVTPNLNKLSKEGLLFTNFYGNGDRTDKAIPAILSGYYPQPIKRIMRMPNKTRSLPMLPKKMKALGYKNSFYYGGDLNFGNMNTYLRNAGINNIVDGSVFDKDDWNSKWGAYDDVFMKKFAEDLSKKQEQPFFKIALTLSSHEPYEIRGAYKFGKNTEENKYRSSHFYTDAVIGDFISFAKKQDWYTNTLIIIMGDHGHTYPIHKGPYFSPKKFRTPMLWLGGALLKKQTTITSFVSQVDLPYTLLDLLNGDNTEFNFGKHIFNTSDNQYAHYVFNKGYGTITKNGVFVYDYIGKKPILETGRNTQKLDSLGKAITQDSYQDFLDRK